MSTEINFLNSFFQMIFALVIVLLLIYITSKIGKRFTGESSKRNLKVVDRLPLSNKSSICVVKVGDEMLLLGVSENNINILEKLPHDFEERYTANDISNIKFGQFENVPAEAVHVDCLNLSILHHPGDEKQNASFIYQVFNKKKNDQKES